MNMKGVLQIALVMLAATLLVLPVSGTFAVTGITPDTWVNTGTVFITNLSGTDFPEAASVRLTFPEETNITGQYVTWVGPTRITCVFDLEGAAAGDWDVVVVNNTDAEEAVLAGGFSVRNPAPVITAITPDEGVNTGTISITSLAGANFLPGAGVVLTKKDSTNISGTSVVVVNPTKIECQFDLTGAATGDWDVVVTNSDGQSATWAENFTVRYPKPSVFGISPDSGKNDEVIGITNLAGIHFRNGASVVLTRDGEPNITTIDEPIVTPTRILCFFDLIGKEVGAWNVVVKNPDGQSDTYPAGFSIFYPEAPNVTGITPTKGENSGTVAITGLSGTGFQPNATVKLTRTDQPDIPGTSVDVIGSTMLTCEFDLSGAEAETWNVVVTNRDRQSATLARAFTITYPAPTLSAVTPKIGLNSGTMNITNLSGTGFLDGATVTLFRSEEPDIAAFPVTVESPERISCTVNLSGAKPGLWSLRVTNPDFQEDELPDSFRIVHPAPSVTGIFPPSGTAGDVFSAVVTGHSFLPGATVNLTRAGGATVPAAVSAVTPTTINCTFDLSGITAGPMSLVVTNPDEQSDSLSDAFTVNNPAPFVSDASPDRGSNDGNTGIITLTGTGFLDGAEVKLARDGQPDIPAKGKPVVENQTTIFCFFDLTNAKVGFWDVVVTNTDRLSGVLADRFLISYPAAPEITGIDPVSGVNTGPVTITSLSGTGFRPGATVRLVKPGKTAIQGTGVTVAGPGHITCTFNLAGAETGDWDIVVINDDGQQGILHGGFAIRYPAPAPQSVTPSSGYNNGTLFITNLSGSGFLPGAAVRLTKMNQSDIVATNITVVSSNKITCQVNLAGREPGPWNVVVVNTDSQVGIRTNAFTIENPNPTVSSISPNRGANDTGALNCSLTGTGFLDGATVHLIKTGKEPITATSVNVESRTKITCTFNLTGREPGRWNVVVINPGPKSGTLGSGFEITQPQPVPEFTADPLFGTAPLTVRFTDQSTNSPSLWLWNFGDGTTVAGLDQQNPVHTYQEPGQYTVLLQVTNRGGSAQLVKQAFITVVSTPVANFTAEPVNGSVPLLVQFADTSSGKPVKWFWTFGDGGFSTQQNPYHLYQKAGNYTVSLTAYNQAGSDTVTRTDLVKVTSRPVAAFTANRTVGIAPLAVKFTDISQGSPTSWSWKFGDDGGITEQDPVHVFTKPGVYSVQLTVSNSAGSSTEVKEGYITVNQDLMADFDFTVSNNDMVAPLTVAFTDRSIGKPLSFSWRFGDGFVTNERNPIHNYQNPGTYAVTLSVHDLMASSSVTKTIVVKSPLKADFYAYPVTGSAPLTVALTDTSVGQPVQRYWVINKGLSVIVLNPGDSQELYTINEPGLYNVTLNITDAYGSTSEVVKTNYINVLEFPP